MLQLIPSIATVPLACRRASVSCAHHTRTLHLPSIWVGLYWVLSSLFDYYIQSSAWIFKVQLGWYLILIILGIILLLLREFRASKKNCPQVIRAFFFNWMQNN